MRYMSENEKMRADGRRIHPFALSEKHPVSVKILKRAEERMFPESITFGHLI